jgi:hypothetical protein
MPRRAKSRWMARAAWNRGGAVAAPIARRVAAQIGSQVASPLASQLGAPRDAAQEDTALAANGRSE